MKVTIYPLELFNSDPASGISGDTKINANFTEVYAGIAANAAGVASASSTAAAAQTTGTNALTAATAVAARRIPARTRPLSLTVDTPTITYGTGQPATTGMRAFLPWHGNGTPADCGPAWSNTANQLTPFTGAAFQGVDCIISGTSITFTWNCGKATGERFMFWVDGYPVSLTPVTPSVTTVFSNTYYVTLTWGAAAIRRVEILGTSLQYITACLVPITSTVYDAPPRRKIHIVGDSYNGVSTAVFTNDQFPAGQMAILYGASVSADGQGGTGYNTVNGQYPVFGDAARVGYAANIQPDTIIFMGSVNDDTSTQAQVQAAAIATYQAYQAACPNAKIIVFGPQPNNATSTLSTARQANCAAVAAACTQLGIPFFDMIGWTKGTVVPFAANTSYPSGQLVSYLGSIWQASPSATKSYNQAGAYPGGAFGWWSLVTFDLYGTGASGATTGDGSRDVLLANDGVHHTIYQFRNDGIRMMEAANALS